jgi:hypothetical protein
MPFMVTGKAATGTRILLVQIVQRTRIILEEILRV